MDMVEGFIPFKERAPEPGQVVDILVAFPDGSCSYYLRDAWSEIYSTATPSFTHWRPVDGG